MDTVRRRKYSLKIILTVLMTVFVLSSCLVSCGKVNETKEPSDAGSGEKRLHIVTTIFPIYDWTNNILGDDASNIDVTLLTDNGVDMHSYQPSVHDMTLISDCDMLIYVGGESDEWIEEALDENKSDDMIVVKLIDVIGDSAKEEEVVPGAQESTHEEDEEGDDEDETEYDEHIWLSLRNAQICVGAISDALQQLDGKDVAAFESNANSYIKQLSDMDNEYKSVIAGADKDTLLFGDRFPFRYLTDDYGLKYYAAFDGCSSETEASFETIRSLAEKLDELSLDVVLTIEGSGQKVAGTIVKSSEDMHTKIMTLDSMQSVKKEDIDDGVSYISVMQKNLDVIKEALE